MLKGVKYQLVVIPRTYHIGNNRSVIEIQNSAEVELVNNRAFVPFEFRDIPNRGTKYFLCSGFL